MSAMTRDDDAGRTKPAGDNAEGRHEALAVQLPAPGGGDQRGAARAPQCGVAMRAARIWRQRHQQRDREDAAA